MTEKPRRARDKNGKDVTPVILAIKNDKQELTGNSYYLSFSTIDSIKALNSTQKDVKLGKVF
jgi:hypothetical protein